MDKLTEVRVDYGDRYDIYNGIVAANKLLKANGLKIRFEYDLEEHDGFDILRLVEVENENEKVPNSSA